MSITVECQKRPEGSKPNALRREGFIPAALYGHNGNESISLTITAKDAQLLLKNAAVNNTLVDLNVPDLPWSGKALIREVQVHPWKKTLRHLSFFSVAAHGTLELVVPIKIVGEAAGMKQGGILEQMMTELNISCAAENIPEFIELDVSQFEIGSNLHVGEVVLPEGVKALDESERTVLALVPPAKAEITTEETVVQTEA
jgi:large subunit ribosomal protein L25